MHNFIFQFMVANLLTVSPIGSGSDRQMQIPHPDQWLTVKTCIFYSRLDGSSRKSQHSSGRESPNLSQGSDHSQQRHQRHHHHQVAYSGTSEFLHGKTFCSHKLMMLFRFSECRKLLKILILPKNIY